MMLTHWTTRDGRKIPYAQMTQSHLENAYILCLRKLDTLTPIQHLSNRGLLALLKTARLKIELLLRK
jgi:hypothetical protein